MGKINVYYKIVRKKKNMEIEEIYT